MDFATYFGNQIKVLRIENNLTQQQLGQMVGLSKQAINDIEKGRRTTTIEKAFLISQALNTTVEYLCDMSNADNPNSHKL